MNYILGKLITRRLTITYICTIFLFFQSCNQDTNLVVDPTQPESITEKSDIVFAASKISSNNNFRDLLTETANIEADFRNGKIRMKPIDSDELQRLLSSIKSEEELGKLLIRISNNPDKILTSIKRISTMMNKLDQEVHFTNLKPENRSVAFKEAFASLVVEKKGIQAIYQNGEVHTMARQSDCGGICNNVYWHTVEQAAAGLAVATSFGFAASWLGGPAGIAAGAGGIAGAVVGFYVSEHYALISLGDCFSACPGGSIPVEYEDK